MPRSARYRSKYWSVVISIDIGLLHKAGGWVTAGSGRWCKSGENEDYSPMEDFGKSHENQFIENYSAGRCSDNTKQSNGGKHIDRSIRSGNMCESGHGIDKFLQWLFQAVYDQQATAGKVCVPEGTNRTHLVEAYANTAAVLIARELSRITRQLPDMLYLRHSDMLECRGTVTATIPIRVCNPSKC